MVMLFAWVEGSPKGGYLDLKGAFTTYEEARETFAHVFPGVTGATILGHAVIVREARADMIRLRRGKYTSNIVEEYPV